MGVKHRAATRLDLCGNMLRGRSFTNDDKRVGAFELRGQRRPQGARRKDPAIADAAGAIDHHE